MGECTLQLLSITAQGFRIQPCPRGTPMQSAQGWQSQTEGEKFKRTDGACADPDTRIFPATGAMRQVGGSAAFQFYSIDFHVTNRFFVTFLVRPALLPYGKRGFRAAICKIARPQPPAATL